jgi:hypothetical protein
MLMATKLHLTDHGQSFEQVGYTLRNTFHTKRGFTRWSDSFKNWPTIWMQLVNMDIPSRLILSIAQIKLYM